MTFSLWMIPLAALSLFAQQNAGAGQQNGGRGPAPAPKNLKVLAPDANLRQVMQNFTQALGVQCSYCHVQNDFASDQNPRKQTARKMIAMVRQIDTSFVSSQDVYPAGYHEVDCITCHRGSIKPETKAAEVFYNLAESIGQGRAGKGLGTNLKVLPADTVVHGEGSIMHEFRDALGVDCGFCHGGNGGFAKDDNPRKDIARKMVLLVRQINANFPGTGVYPVGTQAVTCNTCHRGETHPASLSNKRYPEPAPAR
jgi:hypothetical protein